MQEQSMRPQTVCNEISATKFKRRNDGTKCSPNFLNLRFAFRILRCPDFDGCTSIPREREVLQQLDPHIGQNRPSTLFTNKMDGDGQKIVNIFNQLRYM